MTLSMQVKSIPTFRDLKGRFATANKDLLNFRRNQMRPEMNRLVGITKAEAPKKTGQFREGIFSRIFVSGNAITGKVFMPQPLGKWIIRGTKRHPIPKSLGGKILRFFWPKGPKGPGIYFFRQVDHPGTKPNPFTDRALKTWLPGAERQLRRVSTRWITKAFSK